MRRPVQRATALGRSVPSPAGAEDLTGALGPLPAQMAAGLSGTMRGFIWPTEFLMFSDFLVAKPHAHSALQLVVGLEGDPRVHIEGTWHEVPGLLLDTGMTHGLDVTDRLAGIGWVEAESRLGQRLRERVLVGHSWAPLDVDTAVQVGAAWCPAIERATPCMRAFACWRAGIAVLTGEAEAAPPVDARIQAVLDLLRTTPSPPPSVTDLMARANLSESRLQHLFREQVGVPIRRYLLWQRVLTAMRCLAAGASVTGAAHAAGFADGAHLTRTAHQMNGVLPSDMAAMAPWVSDCC